MKTIYIVSVSPFINGIADVYYNERGDVYEITRINVPRAARSKGYGRQLLKQILADADAEGVRLRLYPSESGGLERHALIAWYQRYGFRRKGCSIYWYREPVKSQACT